MKGTLETADKVQRIIKLANTKTELDRKKGLIYGKIMDHRNDIIRRLCYLEDIDYYYILKVRGVDV